MLPSSGSSSFSLFATLAVATTLFTSLIEVVFAAGPPFIDQHHNHLHGPRLHRRSKIWSPSSSAPPSTLSITTKHTSSSTPSLTLSTIQDKINATTFTATAISSALAAKTSISSPSPPSSSPSSGGCPAGSVYADFIDTFTSFDPSKWTREVGEDDSSIFGSDGLHMYLNQNMQNIVFQSVKQWLPPVTMSVSMKTTNAPGIVHCAIFKNEDASDEIDLEIVQGLVEILLWKDGSRLQFGVDVAGVVGNQFVNHSAWEYYDQASLPYEAVHEYTVQWNPSSLSWSSDGNSIVDFTKLTGTGAQKWPSEALHVRFGPWVAGGTWAGQVDWKTFPNPVQQMTKMEISGCMVE